jgi:RNA polymerase sigma-70 factor (ECF subfamily)
MSVSSAEDGRALVKRMLAGQESAFEEFFGDHFPPLYRFALTRVRDADAAEEVVQAALCRALGRLETYRGEAALSTWLFTFCRHEIAAHYERQARRPAHVDLIEDLPEVRAAIESLAADAVGDPESRLQREELGRLVQVALDQLPRRYGDALEWKYIDGLSVREIGERLCVSAKAAESLLTRARVAFRDGFLTLGGAVVRSRPVGQG